MPSRALPHRQKAVFPTKGRCGGETARRPARPILYGISARFASGCGLFFSRPARSACSHTPMLNVGVAERPCKGHYSSRRERCAMVAPTAPAAAFSFFLLLQPYFYLPFAASCLFDSIFHTESINDWVFTVNPSTSGVPASLLSIVHSAKTGILFYSTLALNSPASIACGSYMNGKAAGAKEALRLC